MATINAHQLEIIAFLLLYIGLYIVVEDPIVGEITGFDTPPWK